METILKTLEDKEKGQEHEQETTKFRSPVQKDLLISQLSKLIHDENNYDVCFLVGEEKKRIYAHKNILGVRCEYFRVMLYGGMREAKANEIEIPGIQPTIFLLLLEYIYTATLTLSPTTAMPVFCCCKSVGINRGTKNIHGIHWKEHRH